MKKIAFLVSLMFVTITMAAQAITGTSRIILSTDGQPDAQVNLLLSASFSDAFDNTWDAENANPSTGIYVVKNEKQFTTWASNEYTTNLALGFGAGENTSYTLKFTSFSGTEYTIYDRATGTTIDVNGTTPNYDFTIAAGDKNSAINNRFVINYVSGGLDVCFIDNKLQINDNPYLETIVIKDANGAEIAGSPFASYTTVVDFSTIGAAGDRFTVEFAGGARKFIVVKQ